MSIYRLFLLFFMLVLAKTGISQTEIQGVLKAFPETKFYIFSYPNSNEKLLDSITSDQKGAFTYLVKGNYGGILRIKNNQFEFDIIVKEPKIEFHLEQLSPDKKFNFAVSQENKVYYEYLGRKQKFLKKSNLLLPVVYEYPKEEAFYNELIQEFKHIHEVYELFLDSITTFHPDLFATEIILFDRLPYIHPETPRSKVIEIFKKDFFKYARFSDTSLFQTPHYPQKIVEYLSFYGDQGYSKQQQERAFMDAASRLMEFTYEHPKFYSYTINYLIEGFSQFGMDNVVDFIAENSDIEGSCKNENVDAEVQRRIENLKKMTVGKKAPDFSAVDQNENFFKLSETPAKHKLIVFWASSCPHCQKVLPRLQKIYEKYDGSFLEIYSVSIDTSQTEYSSFMEEHEFTWIDICDFKGWSGKIAEKYNIYATPMMFLLDSDLKIMAKPADTRELDKVLNDLAN